jgi:hypothetical protein
LIENKSKERRTAMVGTRVERSIRLRYDDLPSGGMIDGERKIRCGFRIVEQTHLFPWGENKIFDAIGNHLEVNLRYDPERLAHSQRAFETVVSDPILLTEFLKAKGFLDRSIEAPVSFEMLTTPDGSEGVLFSRIPNWEGVYQRIYPVMGCDAAETAKVLRMLQHKPGTWAKQLYMAPGFDEAFEVCFDTTEVNTNPYRSFEFHIYPAGDRIYTGRGFVEGLIEFMGDPRKPAA